MPLSAKSSPKRCPTENYSTAFGRMMPREEHLVKRWETHNISSQVCLTAIAGYFEKYGYSFSSGEFETNLMSELKSIKIILA